MKLLQLSCYTCAYEKGGTHPLLHPFWKTQILLKSKLAIIERPIALPFQRDQSCSSLLALTLTVGLCCR
jgi:hypothetical protein